MSSGYRIHVASDHRFVYNSMVSFPVGPALVKLYFSQCGDWCGLVFAELCQHHPNIAVWIDDDHKMLPIVFDVYGEIDDNTPELIHTEHVFHFFFCLVSHAIITNHEEIISNPSDCVNYSALISHDCQSSVKSWCHEPSSENKLQTTAIPNPQRWFQAMKWSPPGENCLLQSLG